MTPKAIILVNPAAGSFRTSLPAAAGNFLRRRGCQTSCLCSRRQGEIELLARQAAAARPAMIVVIGGDGTFNEAVNGLAPTTIPLVYLPAGTANVLAAELGLPGGTFNILARALSQPARKISLGEVVLAGGRRRYFTLMAGAGFDGRVVRDVSPRLKRRWGRGAYLWSALRALAAYRPETIRIRAAGRELTGYGVVAAKAAHYGGRFRIAPDASLAKPELEILVLEDSSRTALLRTAWQTIRNPEGEIAGTRRLTTSEIELDGQAPLQVDGDYLGCLPATIRVLPEALRLLG